MNAKKLVLNVAKVVILVIVLYIGIPYVVEGYRLTQEIPRPEKPISFEAEMTFRPRDRAFTIGHVKIDMKPTEAFVIGDKITADIKVSVTRSRNESASVYLSFIDCLSMDSQQAWPNTSRYDEVILLESDTFDYRARAFVRYTHEGIFGFELSIYSPYSLALSENFETLERTVHWSFPELITVKPYSYLEERLNAQFTNALTLEILGLTIIALSPIAVTLVDLVGKVIESLFEEK